MKIGFLWHCVYPWDVRLEKMIGAVVDQGNTACIVCKGRDDLPPRQELGSITIRRVIAPDWFPSQVNKFATFPFFFNPIWVHEVRKAMHEEDLDMLVVRDVPLALLAAQAGQRSKRPVILDMAENYPAALLSYDKLPYKPILLGNAWLPRKYERMCLRAVDHVLVVAEEQRLRLLKLGIPPEKLTLVGNTPVDSFLRSADTCAGDLSAIETSPTMNLLYVGFIDPHRGADIAVRALPALLKEFPTLTLTLVGDGTAKKGLTRMAEELGIAESVSLPGWVDFPEVPTYIRKSTLCLIPHLESEHTNTTLPNKLFDYMAFSKPIVAADCKPIQRVIDEANCGITFRSGDISDFVRAVGHLIRDPLRSVKGQNGRVAVECKYNWEIDKNVFLNTISSIGNRPEYARRATHQVHHHC